MQHVTEFPITGKAGEVIFNLTTNAYYKYVDGSWLEYDPFVLGVRTVVV